MFCVSSVGVFWSGLVWVSVGLGWLGSVALLGLEGDGVVGVLLFPVSSEGGVASGVIGVALLGLEGNGAWFSVVEGSGTA